MNQVSFTDFKKMRIEEIARQIPLEITYNGEVIGVLGKKASVINLKALKTKCPNCKMEYHVTLPDGKPPFFTIKHK